MRHSYACSVLRNNKMKIFESNRQILNSEYVREHLPLMTKIEKGNDFRRYFLQGVQVSTTKDIAEINRLGFKVIKYSATGKYFSGQRVALKLVRLNHPVEESATMNNLPANHYIEIDPVNRCLTGVGKNFSHTGRGHPLPIKDSRPHEGNPSDDIMDLMKCEERALNDLCKDTLFGNKSNYFLIPELVIGVTEEGYILTLPKPRRTDPYFLELIGGRGVGKSMLEDNFECGWHHKFGIMCANVNDLKPETQTRCLEWNDSIFRDELYRFGEPTVPTPAVYLHPTTSKDYDKIHYQEVGFDVSMPYKSILKDANLLKYNQAWKLKDDTSGLQFKNLLMREGVYRFDGLLNATTIAEAHKIIEAEVSDRGMKEKLKRVMSDIFNSKIIDKSSYVSARWLLGKEGVKVAESPWNVCMMAGLFPYLNTSGIRDQIWFPLWLRYIISDIIRFAESQKTQQVHLFMDEIAPLMKRKVTKEIIEQLIRECRSAHLGITIVSHAFSDVPSEIHTHNPIRFIFRTNEPAMASELKRLGHKRASKEISELKQFECWAFGDFKLYDTDGSSFSNEGKPVKVIKIKPPNCRHYSG